MMLAKIRDKINAIRLNYTHRKRKKTLSKQIDKNNVSHLAKTVNCHSEWYGSSYGGFYIHPNLLGTDSVIYSFGIGKDISFDKACQKKHQCKIFAFDPTPKSINYIKRNKIPSEQFRFFDYGISDLKSGVMNFYLPANPKGTSGSLMHISSVNPNKAITVKMKTFDDIAKELGHTHIDVLKMDIEGSEYDVLAKILESKVTVDQLLVEFHDRLFDLNHYKSEKIVKKLKEKGYEIFAHSMTYEEISFIHKSKLSLNPKTN